MEENEISCECMIKLSIIGKVKEYNSSADTLSNYAQEVEDGHMCLVFDSIIDTGDINQDGEWNTNIEVTKELYPIEYCPVCGKKVIHSKEDEIKLILE